MSDDRCMHELVADECSLCRSPKPRWSPPKRLKPTTSPQSADDPIAPLAGTKDVSTPVHALGPYLDMCTDWIPAQYAYPRDFRPRGWVYLRGDARLAARAKASTMQWRSERPLRTGELPGTQGFFPGVAFQVDPASREPFDQDLGDDADRMRQGYRYHPTDRTGVVHHFAMNASVFKGDRNLDG